MLTFRKGLQHLWKIVAGFWKVLSRNSSLFVLIEALLLKKAQNFSIFIVKPITTNANALVMGFYIY